MVYFCYAWIFTFWGHRHYTAHTKTHTRIMHALNGFAHYVQTMVGLVYDWMLDLCTWHETIGKLQPTLSCWTMHALLIVTVSQNWAEAENWLANMPAGAHAQTTMRAYFSSNSLCSNDSKYMSIGYIHHWCFHKLLNPTSLKVHLQLDLCVSRTLDSAVVLSMLSPCNPIVLDQVLPQWSQGFGRLHAKFGYMNILLAPPTPFICGQYYCQRPTHKYEATQLRVRLHEALQVHVASQMLKMQATNGSSTHRLSY